MTSTKRPHTPPSTTEPDSTSPTPKAKRTAHLPERDAARPLLCTLPPTCHPPNNRPTPLESTRDLEAHYAKYHAHVCEVRGCHCVFPDARLLELHIAENHDPLAQVRKERGEKIFACYLASCGRNFLTPKARRLHLITAHGYPKEYFFAVTNWGVGGLLRRWGEGASLIRGTWKAREGQEKNGQDDEDDEDGDEDEEEADMPIDEDRELSPTPKERKQQQQVPPARPAPGRGKPEEAAVAADADKALDALTSNMSSLSLVPSSVRFGRGGKGSGMGFAGQRGQHAAATPTTGKTQEKANRHGHEQTTERADTVMEAEESRDAHSANTNGNAAPKADADAGAGTRTSAGGEAQGPSQNGAPANANANANSRGRGNPRGRGRGAGRGFVVRGGFVPPPPRGGFIRGLGVPRGAIGMGVGVGVSRGRGRGRGRGGDGL
ncbi:hypothetical protein EVG20_g4100 [Dentipellis fragilis]|uniref:C2H2-type domain-containing protein n=1 Tax=Dentipellis fragilis TaxID=205917 RepID=A0A4Y9YZ28_9AGAM|nr:hypothetical protein EVG20_g4100 [Dentipellis fragilis]